MSLSIPSTRLLNTSMDGDANISLGAPSQCLTTLSMKKFFLIPNLNLPLHSLRPFPRVPTLVAWEKRPTPSSLQPPQEASSRQPWNQTAERHQKQCLSQGSPCMLAQTCRKTMWGCWKEHGVSGEGNSSSAALCFKGSTLVLFPLPKHPGRLFTISVRQAINPSITSKPDRV